MADAFDVLWLMLWTGILTYELFARKPEPKKFWVIFAGFMIWLHASAVIDTLEKCKEL